MNKEKIQQIKELMKFMKENDVLSFKIEDVEVVFNFNTNNKEGAFMNPLGELNQIGAENEDALLFVSENS